MRTVLRRTKIVATLGPATDTEEAIDGLMKAGIDVVRLNFSHGTAEDHKARYQRVLEVGKRNQRYVAVLADLQGPKIRIEKFKNGAIELARGADFCLDTECASDAGDETRVGVTYTPLAGDVTADNVLVLDDGRILLRVKSVDGSKINCEVTVGGSLSDSKGINLQGGGLSADALTDKDKADIVTAADIGVDYVAVSFPRNADDINLARELLREAGSEAGVVAKIIE